MVVLSEICYIPVVLTRIDVTLCEQQTVLLQIANPWAVVPSTIRLRFKRRLTTVWLAIQPRRYDCRHICVCVLLH